MAVNGDNKYIKIAAQDYQAGIDKSGSIIVLGSGKSISSGSIPALLFFLPPQYLLFPIF